MQTRRKTQPSAPAAYRSNSPESVSSGSTRSHSDESVSSLVGSFASPSSRGGRPQGSTGKGRSNKRSLKQIEQKLLASDVEEFGGLQAIFGQKLGLRAFCDRFATKDEERAAVYGVVNSKQRDRIRHKLDYWRGLGQGYQELLAEWRIVPACFQSPESKKPSTQEKTDQVPTFVSRTPTPVVDLSSSFSSLKLSRPEPRKLGVEFETMADHKICKSCWICD